MKLASTWTHMKQSACVFNVKAPSPFLSGIPLKLKDKFTYLGSNVSSTDSDVNIHLLKAWTVICRLSIIWKSDLSDKIKRDVFQAMAVSTLLYRSTTWTQTKRIEKRPDGNYTRMLRAIMNKSWKQHPTKQQLCGHLLSISKTIQVRRMGHAVHCCGSKDKLISDILFYGPPHTDVSVLADQRELIYINSVRIRDVVWKTCREWWMIGIEGKRQSGKAVLSRQLDDDDDDDDESSSWVTFEVVVWSMWFWSKKN